MMFKMSLTHRDIFLPWTGGLMGSYLLFGFVLLIGNRCWPGGLTNVNMETNKSDLLPAALGVAKKPIYKLPTKHDCILIVFPAIHDCILDVVFPFSQCECKVRCCYCCCQCCGCYCCSSQLSVAALVVFSVLPCLCLPLSFLSSSPNCPLLPGGLAN